MGNAIPETISWVHFGDLHITSQDETNYRDFIALVDDANAHLAGDVDFAVLPGDNADDGTEAQYLLIRRAVDRLRIPLEVRTGDHDRKSGTLDAYTRILEARLWRNRVIGPYRCLFLNSLDGPRKDAFALGPDQVRWFRAECEAALGEGQALVLFVHAYPSEFGETAEVLREAIAHYRVIVVDMGHTHYNELANDGHTIYAATRSTGQIEEGPAGLSITTIDRGVVSWKFNELARWPLVKVISPADRALIIDPNSSLQVVRGEIEIRARVWGDPDVTVSCSIDAAESKEMQRIDGSNVWRCRWNSNALPDATHRLVVEAGTKDRRVTHDAIDVLTSQSGSYDAPRYAARDLENAVAAKPERGLLGTRLGPNANGRKW